MYLITEADRHLLLNAKNQSIACPVQDLSIIDPNSTSMLDLERRYQNLINVPPPALPPPSPPHHPPSPPHHSPTPPHQPSTHADNKKLRKELTSCRTKLVECMLKNWQTLKGQQLTATPIASTPKLKRRKRAPNKFSP
jgi:hypothetical protein